MLKIEIGPHLVVTSIHETEADDECLQRSELLNITKVIARRMRFPEGGKHETFPVCGSCPRN